MQNLSVRGWGPLAGLVRLCGGLRPGALGGFFDGDAEAEGLELAEVGGDLAIAARALRFRAWCGACDRTGTFTHHFLAPPQPIRSPPRFPGRGASLRVRCGPTIATPILFAFRDAPQDLSARR